MADKADLVHVEIFGQTYAVKAGGDPAYVEKLAASLDQVSPHVLAGAIVRAARGHDVTLTFPEGVHEEHGAGIEGRVDGRAVALGPVEG